MKCTYYFNKAIKLLQCCICYFIQLITVHTLLFSLYYAALNLIMHCLIAGNDCVFENNTLDTLCYESSDSGAFYSGRSWIDRGNIIRGNTFKNILNTEKTHLGYPSVQAIYLDDQVCGAS